MSSEAVRFEGFSCRHAGAKSPAIRELDLSLRTGEMTLIAGPSGSGKSTLLRAACGLMPGFDGGTAAGRVVTGGLDTREHGAAAIGAACGTVLQDPERQALMSTVRGELAFPLESRGFAAAAIARAVEEAALLTGTENLLDRSMKTLSGGELQRVAIAAALAPGPSILLLDEPTSQLDPVAADDLAWLLRRLNEEQGITVVIAEQRLERLLPAADRVVVLSEGRVACDATPGGFLTWAAGRAPALQTPAGVLFELAGLPAPPTTVKQARAELSLRGLLPEAGTVGVPAAGSRRRARKGERPALELVRVWDEPKGVAPLLAGIDLRVVAGETVAVMGRNGAGKSTLLRNAAGLRTPTRGKVRSAGRVAMLTQGASDSLIAERIGDLFDAESLARAAIAVDADRHPRDLSGGERQWLACELVMGGARAGDAILLDEPTRGLDRARRGVLAERMAEKAESGSAVVIATHDPELAAEVADRVVLMAGGVIIAEGSPVEMLAGGRHFTTETARILGPGASALLPAAGAALIRANGPVRG